MFMRWFGFAVLNILMFVLAMVLAPVLPLFAIGRDVLPAWLSWFQTPDNGLDGDANFKANVAPFRGDQVGWRRYVNRIRWLWRNPAYGFDISVLGFALAPETKVQTVGTREFSGALKSGWFFAMAINADGSMAWQFYAVKVWGARASRVDFGWKLWGDPGVCQYALSVNPWLTV